MRVCTVCRHEDRALIDEELARGEPLRNIAITFRLGYSSLRRHRMDHMIAVDENGTKVALTIEDVINIPLKMRERNQLIKALISRTLEPLAKPGGRLAGVQAGFLVRLFKLQQDDEQTILRMTGVLQAEESDASSFLTSDAYKQILMDIEARRGDYQEARLLQAEALLPTDEIESLPGPVRFP